MGHKITNVFAVALGSFPYGGASTNRFLSYLRGLAELGCKVKLVVLAPDKQQSPLSNRKKFNINNINISYSCLFQYPRGRIFFWLNYFFGIARGLLFMTLFRVKNGPRSALLLLTPGPVSMFLFLILGRLLRIRILHERAEYPHLGGDSGILFRFYLKFIVPRLDGIYVITHALIDYFKEYTSKKILLLPMTVETDRFDHLERKPVERYIGYCGSMYTDKDGVPDLIEAFNIVARRDLTLKLYLIGDTSDKMRFAIVQDRINQSEFKDRIVCPGFIERDEMPSVLMNAELLALARPDNLQAQGGFPTKLGEYLSTGNPVVITDVGEHKLYLTDGKTAYIAPPENPELFAEKIFEITGNPEKARKIGLEGKKLAYQCFDYKVNARKLFDYINEV